MVQRERDAQQTRQKTHNKMAAFLDAAASGQLWTDRTCKTTSEAVTKTETPSANDESVTDEPAVRFACISMPELQNFKCNWSSAFDSMGFWFRFKDICGRAVVFS